MQRPGFITITGYFLQAAADYSSFAWLQIVGRIFITAGKIVDVLDRPR